MVIAVCILLTGYHSGFRDGYYIGAMDAFLGSITLESLCMDYPECRKYIEER